jgi:hypothetical protein
VAVTSKPAALAEWFMAVTAVDIQPLLPHKRTAVTVIDIPAVLAQQRTAVCDCNLYTSSVTAHMHGSDCD